MDRITRTDLFVHDMVHDNPGLVKYQSIYNNPTFLKERGYDGKTFDLYNCAQYGLTFDALAQKYGRAPIFPEGSEAREWVLAKRAELKKLYSEATENGLNVSFMMDIIVFPAALLEIYPEILNENGKIDIMKPETREIMQEMFDEMFSVFPQIKGIYIRYGETYTGPRYSLIHHRGNNPILKDGEEYHISLINALIDMVCVKHNREIYYRSWGFGKFQYDKETYLRISEKIPVNDNFYFCIKHTSGDFHRVKVFNQSLNCGKHQQIVEVQAAREYEGKGAYPNYVGDGVINGYEEFKWLMPSEDNRSLRDVINVPNSLIKGVWTWSRGGGWDGPYINGRNGKDGEVVIENGSELWCDVNAYVLSHWARDTSKSDRYYVLKYAKEVLEMSEVDALRFYEICILSAKAILLGRGCNTEKYPWAELWTRDQNIMPILFYKNIKEAIKVGEWQLLLWERKQSVKIWEQILELANSIESGNQKEYIVTTCKYGYYLYSLYETMFRANTYDLLGENSQEIKNALSQYDELWDKWIELKETDSSCPTLYVKADENQMLIGYQGNRGFDSVMNNLKEKYL